MKETVANMSAVAHPNYTKIWLLLVGLLVVSVCGPFIGIKVVTLITAFGIAVVKAYIVAKYFMHLDIQPKYVTYLLISMIAFMVILFAGVAPDVMKHDGQQWSNLAAKEEIARAQGKMGAGDVGPAKPQTTEETFKGLCGSCHGEKGDGQGPAAVALKPRPANFTDPAFWATRDRAHIAKVVREGGPAVGKSALMAPFGAQLAPDVFEKLVDYVMKFNPGSTVPASATSAAPDSSAGPVPAASGSAGPAPATSGSAGPAPTPATSSSAGVPAKP